MYALAVVAREGLIQVVLECERIGYNRREASQPSGFSILARAMQSEHPGIVFVRAAATGEIYPLTDVDSRMFVGLPIENQL